MVNPESVIVEQSLDSEGLGSASTRSAHDSTVRPRVRRPTAHNGARHDLSRRASRRISSSIDSGDASRTEWQEKTASQLTLASSVQDNLLEEVFKLQSALDGANSRLTAALTQNDLLQYDVNEAYTIIGSREKTIKDLRSEAISRARDHNLSLSQHGEEVQALETKLEVAKKVEDRYARTIATQKREIEFLEEVQYQLEGDIRELKENLDAKERQIQASAKVQSTNEASLMSKELEHQASVELCERLQQRNSELGHTLARSCASPTRSDHRTSIASAMNQMATIGEEMRHQRISVSALSPPTCMSQESVMTINSIATPSLARNVDNWLADEPELLESKEQSSERPLQIATKSLSDELAAIDDACDIPTLSIVLDHGTAQATPLQEEDAFDLLPISTTAEIGTQTSAIDGPLLVSVGIQTDPEEVHICTKQPQSTRDVRSCSPLKQSEKQATDMEYATVTDGDDDMLLCERSEGAKLGSELSRVDLQSSSARTSHLFEVKDRDGLTELKFCRVDHSTLTNSSFVLRTQRGEERSIERSSTIVSRIENQCCGSSDVQDPPLRVEKRDLAVDGPASEIPASGSHHASTSCREVLDSGSINLELDRYRRTAQEVPARQADKEQIKKQYDYFDLAALGPALTSDQCNEFGKLHRSKSLLEREHFKKLLQPPPQTLNGNSQHQQKVKSLQASELICKPLQLSATEIHAAQLTRTVIGTELYKYIRQARSRSLWGGSKQHDDDVAQRHKRYVMLRPLEGMICWSSSKPAGKMLGFRKCLISEVYDVEDNSAPIPGVMLHDRSILIISAGQTLKFTATNETTHQLWFDVMTRLLQERKVPPAISTICTHSTRQNSTLRRLRSQHKRTSSTASRLAARPKAITRNRLVVPEVSILRVDGDDAASWRDDSSLHEWTSFIPSDKRDVAMSELIPTPIVDDRSLAIPRPVSSKSIAIESLSGDILRGQNRRSHREVSMIDLAGMENSFAAFII